MWYMSRITGKVCVEKGRVVWLCDRFPMVEGRLLGMWMSGLRRIIDVCWRVVK